MILFTPPGRLERRGTDPLFGRRPLTQGISLIKDAASTAAAYGVGPYGAGTFGTGSSDLNTFRQVEQPTNEDIAGAHTVYLGGYTYELSESEALELIDAGYGDWVVGLPAVPYGAGLYGAGPFGGAG